MDLESARLLKKEVDSLAESYDSTIHDNMKALRKMTNTADNWKVSIENLMPLIDGIATMRDKGKLITMALKSGKQFLV